jgi:hypothetical protein
MVPMGRDLVALVLGHQRFTHVMKEGSPEEIGITVKGTGFHRQYGVLGHIALSVILSRLRGASKLGELRDSRNDSVPPARITFPQLFLDWFKWFHWGKERTLAVFSPTRKDLHISGVYLYV